MAAFGIESGDRKKLEEFHNKATDNLAIDGGGHLTYLAPTRVNAIAPGLVETRFPELLKD